MGVCAGHDAMVVCWMRGRYPKCVGLWWSRCQVLLTDVTCTMAMAARPWHMRAENGTGSRTTKHVRTFNSTCKFLRGVRAEPRCPGGRGRPR